MKRNESGPATRTGTIYFSFAFLYPFAIPEIKEFLICFTR